MVINFFVRTLLKSLYISPVVSTFYGTDIEIWAGFGSVRSTEKKCWADYEQLLRVFFFMFSESIFFIYIVVSPIKSCIISLL